MIKILPYFEKDVPELHVIDTGSFVFSFIPDTGSNNELNLFTIDLDPSDLNPSHGVFSTNNKKQKKRNLNPFQTKKLDEEVSLGSISYNITKKNKNN